MSLYTYVKITIMHFEDTFSFVRAGNGNSSERSVSRPERWFPSRGGQIGSQIDGFGLKKRTDCGVKPKIERICGFRKCGGSRFSCEFGSGLRTLSVKKFVSWILKELRVVDLKRLLSVCRHFFCNKNACLLTQKYAFRIISPGLFCVHIVIFNVGRSPCNLDRFFIYFRNR